MTMSSNGWYDNARHVPSPYFDARPKGDDISLLVVHNISLPPGQFGGPHIEQFFTGKLDPTEHPFFKVIHQMGVSGTLLDSSRWGSGAVRFFLRSSLACGSIELRWP